MAPKKKSTAAKSARRARQTPSRGKRLKLNFGNGASQGNGAHSHVNGHNGAVPLRTQTAQALQTYFTHLDGDHPRHLYELVMREVEEPLFRAVLDYVKGNQSRAAEVLGLNRGTLRKKLREHGLATAD